MRKLFETIFILFILCLGLGIKTPSPELIIEQEVKEPLPAMNMQEFNAYLLATYPDLQPYFIFNKEEL